MSLLAASAGFPVADGAGLLAPIGKVFSVFFAVAVYAQCLSVGYDEPQILEVSPRLYVVGVENLFGTATDAFIAISLKNRLAPLSSLRHQSRAFVVEGFPSFPIRGQWSDLRLPRTFPAAAFGAAVSGSEVVATIFACRRHWRITNRPARFRAILCSPSVVVRFKLTAANHALTCDTVQSVFAANFIETIHRATLLTFVWPDEFFSANRAWLRCAFRLSVVSFYEPSGRPIRSSRQVKFRSAAALACCVHESILTIDPLYVDVAVTRWAAFTGKVPVLRTAGGDLPWADVVQLRSGDTSIANRPGTSVW